MRYTIRIEYWRDGKVVHTRALTFERFRPAWLTFRAIAPSADFISLEGA